MLEQYIIDSNGIKRKLGVPTNLEYLNEDTLVSDSDTKAPSESSVKAYVDTHAADTTTHGCTTAVVDTNAQQTLAFKTLTTPVIASIYQNAGSTQLMTLPNTPSDTFAVLAGTQTLTNKTLTTPVVASMYQDAGKTKLMSLPDTASDTLVSLNGTQELDNKTLDSSVAKGTWTSSGVWILPACTLGGSTSISENVSLILAGSLTADGKYCGITEAGTAGIALSFGFLAYQSPADSRWELACGTAATSSACKLGMCIQAATADGSPTAMLLYGKIRADSAFPTFTAGSPVFVGVTAGSVQTTAPVTTGQFIRVVGYGNPGGNELFFDPSKVWVEI